MINVRALYQDSLLSGLYDSLIMPKGLLKVHQDNDCTVMKS
ncbi:type IIL restriction-modification enzyme MmeI [Lactobacillus sp. IBH004]